MVHKQQTTIQAVKEYGTRLFRFIRKRVNTDEDAEDIVQDVWYQFSNTTEVIEQVNAWLHRVARNKITDRYRKKKPDLLDDFTTDEEGESYIKEFLLTDDNNPELDYLKTFFWEQLNKSLHELPKEQRDVFVWNELEGRTFADIAAETGENQKTLISRKGYAVKHLRKQLKTLYDELINM